MEVLMALMIHLLIYSTDIVHIKYYVPGLC